MMREQRKEPFVMGLSVAVQKRRVDLGISQEVLSLRSGLHRTYISDIECAARNPTLKTLLRLAVALELSASGLMQIAECGT